MFDEYLRSRGPSAFREFTQHDYDAYVDGKPPRRTACARSSRRAGSSCPRGRPTIRRPRDGRRPRQPQERARPAPDPRATACEAYEGSVRYVKAGARRRACAAPSSPRAPTAREVLRAAGIEELFEAVIDGVVAEREQPRGKPAPDTFLAGARGARVEPARGGGVRGRARRRRGRPRRRASASSSASTASARPTRCSRTAPTSWSKDLAELLEPSDRPRARPTSCTPGRSARPSSTWTLLAQRESVFALSNGHIGLRGNLDEGEPHGLPGTYLNGVYEARPLPYAEAGYGFPEDGQTVVNVTNGKLIRLLVDDEPFDVRYGELLAHRARARHARRARSRARSSWRSPAGQAVRIRSVRLVSLVQRAVAAILYEVEPIDEPARIVVQSELVANEAAARRAHRRGPAARRPRCARRSCTSSRRRGRHARDARPPHARRAACGWPRPWITCRRGAGRARRRGRRIEDDLGRVTVASDLDGRRHAAASSSSWPTAGRPSARCPALRDQVEAALAEARAHRLGRPGDRPARVRSTTSGSAPTSSSTATTSIQQAVRFGIFHALQAGARAERRAIPAKGLTGPGYDGHAFWDTETFVLPLLTYTLPQAAAAARCTGATRSCRWPASAPGRWASSGAAFPWRTIARRGVLGLLAGRHRRLPRVRRRGRRGDPLRATPPSDARVRARDRARAARRDRAPVAVARPPRPGDGFRIDGVTGPDEYSAIATTTSTRT